MWKVTDTAEALFEVDDYENFVAVQAESALRNLATSHPYDAHNEGQVALRANQAEVADQLRQEIQDRLETAGVQRHRGPDQPPRLRRRRSPTRCSAGSRRTPSSRPGRRSSRARSAWSRWRWSSSRPRTIVELDEERKAAMVSNLLVVLCSEHEAQPVLNTGTLYQ